MVRRIALLVMMVVLGASCSGASTSASSTTTTRLVSIGAGLHGPSGLTASVYARGLTHVAALTTGSDGEVWAATAEYEDKGNDAVYVIAKSGATPVKVISALHTPLGLL